MHQNIAQSRDQAGKLLRNRLGRLRQSRAMDIRNGRGLLGQVSRGGSRGSNGRRDLG